MLRLQGTYALPMAHSPLNFQKLLMQSHLVYCWQAEKLMVYQHSHFPSLALSAYCCATVCLFHFHHCQPTELKMRYWICWSVSHLHHWFQLSTECHQTVKMFAKFQTQLPMNYGHYLWHQYIACEHHHSKPKIEMHLYWCPLKLLFHSWYCCQLHWKWLHQCTFE